MSIKNLKEYKAFDAGYALIVSDGRYAKLIDVATGQEILYTPNPAVYQGGAALQVRWDPTTQSFVTLDVESPLDDRYSKGSVYRLTHQQDTFGGGSGLNSLFTPVDSAGNFITPSSTLNLELAYSDASIHPVLIIEVYEARLASREQFIYVGEPLDDTSAPTYLGYTKEQLINALAADFVVKAQAAYNSFYGTGNVTITYDAASKTFDLDGLIRSDDYTFYGERYNELVNSQAHITQPPGELMLVMPLHGTQWFGLKPFKGAYIMFSYEKLALLPEVLRAALNNITTLTAAQRDELFEKLGYRIGDYFKGMYQTLNVNGVDVTVNVFVSVLGSGVMSAMVTIEDPDNPGTYIEISAVPINIADAFSYEDNKLHKAYPDALAYITGPYGSLPIRDPQTGNVIGYYSDAYNK